MEIYLSKFCLGRPNKEPDTLPGSTEPSRMIDCGVAEIYNRLDDGSVLPVEFYNQCLFPQMEAVVRRVVPCFEYASVNRLRETAAHRRCFGHKKERDVLTGPLQRDSDQASVRGQQIKLAIMGWDFLVDAAGKLWLIEINPLANLEEHAPGVDTGVKGLIAEAVYSLAIAPALEAGGLACPGEFKRL